MACACAAGNWSTGKVETNTVTTEKIESFLGMTSKYADDETGLYPNPKVTDEGVEGSAQWASLAATAVATVNTIAAINIANKQHDIADAYYELARKKWDRFKDSYAPCERMEMDEACNEPEYVPRYTDTSSSWMQENGLNFSTALACGSRYGTMYNVCPNPQSTREAMITQGLSAIDTGNMAYRYEEARRDAKEDVRWNRRQQALNRGRDLEATAARYAEAAADAYGDVGAKIGSAAAGAMSAIGYFSARSDTTYPQRTGLQRPASQFTGGAFIGAQPENGEYGFISQTPRYIDDLTTGYTNPHTPFSSNDAITGEVGAQQPTSSGG